ncbi:hypothetical protein AC622_16470 [Bacillus sp. FJAT-27916]|nr:hypothetical protein AC622_16470 [Bacillus sp. FJAT-27916]
MGHKPLNKGDFLFLRLKANNMTRLFNEDIVRIEIIQFKIVFNILFFRWYIRRYLRKGTAPLE